MDENNINLFIERVYEIRGHSYIGDCQMFHIHSKRDIIIVIIQYKLILMQLEMITFMIKSC